MKKISDVSEKITDVLKKINDVFAMQRGFLKV
jgi:hypothetical protein